MQLITNNNRWFNFLKIAEWFAISASNLSRQKLAVALEYQQTNKDLKD